jgi:hypothetical protein
VTVKTRRRRNRKLRSKRPQKHRKYKKINKSEIVPNKAENMERNFKINWGVQHEQKSCLWDLILLRRAITLNNHMHSLNPFSCFITFPSPDVLSQLSSRENNTMLAAFRFLSDGVFNSFFTYLNGGHVLFAFLLPCKITE